MPNKSLLSQIARGAKNLDDLCHVFTGRRFPQLATKLIDLYGEDAAAVIKKKLGMSEPDVAEILRQADDPFRTLGVNPDAYDCVVKAAFRSLAREYHPDTGTHPDTTKFQKVLDSYNAIMEARKAVSGGH